MKIIAFVIVLLFSIPLQAQKTYTFKCAYSFTTGQDNKLKPSDVVISISDNSFTINGEVYKYSDMIIRWCEKETPGTLRCELENEANHKVYIHSEIGDNDAWLIINYDQAYTKQNQRMFRLNFTVKQTFEIDYFLSPNSTQFDLLQKCFNEIWNRSKYYYDHGKLKKSSWAD